VSQKTIAGTGLMLGSLVLAACGSSTDGPGAGRAETAEQRATAIYAAALEAFLDDAPRAIGDPADMYVVDRAYDKAGSNFEFRNPPGEPIPKKVQAALGQSLVRRADVAWVADEDDVVREGTSEAGMDCPFVRDGDLVVTLDRLAEDGTRDEVSVAAVGYEVDQQSCAIYWLRTFVVEATEDGWQVTGETVPQGIS
jgi:hypothetical protein